MGNNSSKQPDSAARIGLYGLAAVMVIGPLVQVIYPLVAPWPLAVQDFVLDVSAHSVGYVAMSWLGLAGAVCMAPAVAGVGYVAAQRAPRLALAGTVLAVPAMLNPDGNPADVIYLAARSGVPAETVKAMLGHYGELPATGWFGFYAFNIAFAIGGILLGTALLKGRGVPAWAAVTLLLASLIALVGSYVDLGPVVPIAAWAIATAGFARCALVLVAKANAAGGV